MKSDSVEFSSDISRALGTDDPAGPLGKHKRRKKAAEPPANEDPRAELKRLVQEHRALTKKATAIVNMTVDKKSRATGEPIPSRVPEDVKVEMLAVVETMKKRAEQLESKMSKQLKQVPVYQHFLSRVFGLGPVVCAYLVAEIDVHRAEKVSQLRRYCGLAVIDGRLERPRAGVKLGYNGELRTRLYQAFSSMWKNAAKKSAACPNGATSKYLDVWRNYKHRMQHSERFDMKRNRLTNFDSEGERAGAKALIHAAGWHKAADVLVEDIYTVWRTLEGLPVWPSYHAAKLGYAHGGRIVRNEPRLLTLEEALDVVGDPGAKPAMVEAVMVGDDEEEAA